MIFARMDQGWVVLTTEGAWEEDCNGHWHPLWKKKHRLFPLYSLELLWEQGSVRPLHLPEREVLQILQKRCGKYHLITIDTITKKWCL